MADLQFLKWAWLLNFANDINVRLGIIIAIQRYKKSKTSISQKKKKTLRMNSSTPGNLNSTENLFSINYVENSLCTKFMENKFNYTF